MSNDSIGEKYFKRKRDPQEQIAHKSTLFPSTKIAEQSTVPKEAKRPRCLIHINILNKK